MVSVDTWVSVAELSRFSENALARVGCPPAPYLLAVGLRVRRDRDANAVLAARAADEHHAVPGKRSHRLAESSLRLTDRRLPHHVAGPGVERVQQSVERGHEHLAVVHRDTPVVGT